PFDASTPLTLLMRHVHEPPPVLRRVRPDLPADVDLVFQQPLAKAPNARFRSGSVLAQALEDAWPVSAAATIHNQTTKVWTGTALRALVPQGDSAAIRGPVP